MIHLEYKKSINATSMMSINWNPIDFYQTCFLKLYTPNTVYGII